MCSFICIFAWNWLLFILVAIHFNSNSNIYEKNIHLVFFYSAFVNRLSHRVFYSLSISLFDRVVFVLFHLQISTINICVPDDVVCMSVALCHLNDYFLLLSFFVFLSVPFLISNFFLFVLNLKDLTLNVSRMASTVCKQQKKTKQLFMLGLDKDMVSPCPITIALWYLLDCL